MTGRPVEVEPDQGPVVPRFAAERAAADAARRAAAPATSDLGPLSPDETKAAPGPATSVVGVASRPATGGSGIFTDGPAPTASPASPPSSGWSGWSGWPAWPDDDEDDVPPPAPARRAPAPPPAPAAHPAAPGFARRLPISPERLPFWIDALLADGLAALGLLGIWSAHVRHPVVAVVAVAAQALPVLARRRQPLLALVPAVAASAQQFWTEHLITGAAIGILVLLGDIARRRDLRQDALAVVVLAVPAIGMTLLGKVSADEFVMTHVAFFGALGLGDAAGRRVEDRRRHAEEERRSAVERDREVRRAMAEERVNIARELHDVSAHTFGVIGVQAQAALRNLEDKPERTRKSLGIVLGVTVQAANDVRRLVGFLRGADASAPPQPTLGELDLLVERMAEFGLPVEVDRQQGDAVLSPALEASAYRIIEESLLNTVRHANADQATVTVRCRPGWLHIDVADDGSGAAPESREGQGLVGMRERVALFGGTLTFGTDTGGTGYRVRAKLRTDDGGAS